MSNKPRRSFKVGTETWTLHTFDELDGLCIHKPDKEIYIDQELDDDGQVLAVLEEVIHAVEPKMRHARVERLSLAQAAALRVLKAMKGNT